MKTLTVYEELLSEHLRRLPASHIPHLAPLVRRHARQAQRLAATGRLTRRAAIECAHEACRDIDDRIATPEFQELLAPPASVPERKRVRAFFRWYDLWVGAYWDRDARILYVCPLPTVGLAIDFKRGEG